MPVCCFCRRDHFEEKGIDVAVPETKIKLFICHECLNQGVCKCGKVATIWIFGKGYCESCTPPPPC